MLSSPSGGGKTTVIKKLMQEDTSDYIYSISMTTRPKRQGEKNGKDYWFVTQHEFEQQQRAGNLLEAENVHDWWYGTPKAPIQQWVKEGYIVLLDLDVYGALTVKQQFGDKALVIFLKPPNEQDLITRLKNRSTETSEQMERRLQRVPKEMQKADEFDAVVINDKLGDTVNKVKQIIENKRLML